MTNLASLKDKEDGSKFRTYNKFILVEWVDNNQMVGRFHIAVDKGQAGKLPVESKVVATNLLNPLALAKGDTVVFLRKAAEEIMIDNEKYLLISENSLVGIFKTDEEAEKIKEDYVGDKRTDGRIQPFV